MEKGVVSSCVVPWSLLAPYSTSNRTTSRCPWWAAIQRGVSPLSVLPWSLLAPDSTRNRTTSRCPFWAAMKRAVTPLSVLPWSLLAPDSTRNRTTSRCPLPAATKRGVAPAFFVPWSLLAPDSTRNRTTSRCPISAAVNRGVAPISVLPWSLLAPDSTRNWTTAKCPWWAATKRGVIPLSVLAWSLLAPDSTRNWTISICPWWAAMKRGVIPVSVTPWSLLAPDSTRNRTTSRCPWPAAIQRGVAPVSFRPWSLLAPASISKDTQLRFPFRDAVHKGVVPFASSKLGFRGWFKCCSRSLPSLSSHATMMPRSCSISGGRNSILTSCTTCIAKVWSSSNGLLSWSSRSRNRGTPICFAKRCFNAFTEASAKSSFSKTAIDSPVTAETTSTFGNDIKSKISHVNHLKWNILKRNGCLRILHLQNISQPCIKIQASMSSFVGDTDVVWTSYLWCTDGAGWQSTFLKSYTHWWQVPLRPETGTSTSRPSKFVSRGQCR